MDLLIRPVLTEWSARTCCDQKMWRDCPSYRACGTLGRGCTGISWNGWKSSASVRSARIAVGEQLPNRGLVSLAVPRAEEVADQCSVLVIKKCRRELAPPIRKYRLIEFPLFFRFARLLPVIREHWFVARHKAPH